MSRMRLEQNYMTLTVFASNLNVNPEFSPLLQLSNAPPLVSIGFRKGTAYSGLHLERYLNVMRPPRPEDEYLLDVQQVTILYGGPFSTKKTYEVIFNSRIDLINIIDFCELLDDESFYNGLLQKYKPSQIK